MLSVLASQFAAICLMFLFRPGRGEVVSLLYIKAQFTCPGSGFYRIQHSLASSVKTIAPFETHQPPKPRAKNGGAVCISAEILFSHGLIRADIFFRGRSSRAH